MNPDKCRRYLKELSAEVASRSCVGCGETFKTPVDCAAHQSVCLESRTPQSAPCPFCGSSILAAELSIHIKLCRPRELPRSLMRLCRRCNSIRIYYDFRYHVSSCNRRRVSGRRLSDAVMDVMKNRTFCSRCLSYHCTCPLWYSVLRFFYFLLLFVILGEICIFFFYIKCLWIQIIKHGHYSHFLIAVIIDHKRIVITFLFLSEQCLILLNRTWRVQMMMNCLLASSL